MRWLGAIAALVLLAAAPVSVAAQSAAEDSERIALIERVKASVVHVKVPPPPRAEQKRAPRSSRDVDFQEFFEKFGSSLGESRPQEGSGFVVDSQAGLILTAAHIVAKASAVRVALADGSERDAAVAGIDEDSGIALLRVAGAVPPALELSTRYPKAGETAMIVGWMLPLKSLLALEGMVTGPVPGAGNHSSLAPALVDYVAVDIGIPNGGFGGSPVLDRGGKVVGLVSAIFGRDYGPGSLTLMVPGRQIAPLIGELAAKGRIARSRIGIAFDCDPAPCAVTSVDKDSGAAAAGLRAGDRILAVDDLAVGDDVALRRAIAAKPVGTNVALRVQRGPALLDLSVRTDSAN